MIKFVPILIALALLPSHAVAEDSEAMVKYKADLDYLQTQLDQLRSMADSYDNSVEQRNKLHSRHKTLANTAKITANQVERLPTAAPTTIEFSCSPRTGSLLVSYNGHVRLVKETGGPGDNCTPQLAALRQYKSSIGLDDEFYVCGYRPPAGPSNGSFATWTYRIVEDGIRSVRARRTVATGVCLEAANQLNAGLDYQFPHLDSCTTLGYQGDNPKTLHDFADVLSEGTRFVFGGYYTVRNSRNRRSRITLNRAVLCQDDQIIHDVSDQGAPTKQVKPKTHLFNNYIAVFDGILTDQNSQFGYTLQADRGVAIFSLEQKSWLAVTGVGPKFGRSYRNNFMSNSCTKRDVNYSPLDNLIQVTSQKMNCDGTDAEEMEQFCLDISNQTWVEPELCSGS